jgi:hypothetical protein
MSAPLPTSKLPSASRGRFPRRLGIGWKHIEGSAVWEHITGLRIHRLGMARLPDGQCVSWMNQPHWMDAYDAKRQQGWNEKRALMVWALSLTSPNDRGQARRENQ